MNSEQLQDEFLDIADELNLIEASLYMSAGAFQMLDHLESPIKKEYVENAINILERDRENVLGLFDNLLDSLKEM